MSLADSFMAYACHCTIKQLHIKQLSADLKKTLCFTANK